METKIIDGKEYTKVGITELSINGESKENSFSFNDLDDQKQISFDIKIDSNTDIDPNSLATNSLDIKNLELNKNIRIVTEPIAKTSMDTSNYKEYSTDNVDNSTDNKSPLVNKKINYWYYAIFAMALAGLLYFIFIK